MSKLIYITSTSLDGYIEDRSGNFDWGNPEQVFDVITELLRPVGTYLLGRRLYETMAHWEAPVASYPPEQHDFAQLWQRIEKIVFSRTLTGARDARIEKTFDPQRVRKLKQESRHDIGIGGAELASLALDADLLDECHVFLNPVILGGGKPAFRTVERRDLELLQTQRFKTGVVQLHYRIPARA